MAKTAQATALTLTVDPRVRMKEIRAQVANHLKGKAVSEDLGHLKYLSDLPENMDDARRVITALHDLVEKEREKHRKASDHICEMVHTLAFTEKLMCDAADMVQNQQFIIQRLQQQLAAEHKHNHHMTDEMIKSQRERDAAITTMKLVGGIR